MPMNTANKLTLARVFMIPLFLVIAYWGFPGSRYVALGVYILACLTDLLDEIPVDACWTGMWPDTIIRCQTSASLPIRWRISVW